MADVTQSIVPPRRRPGKPHRPHGAFGELASERRELKAREAAEFERRARLAKRDLDYRDSPYAAKVTVEERGGLVIETRGQLCAGWRSSGHVSHNG